MLPAGDQKIGPIDFMVATNATPIAIDSFNNLPIKQVGNAVVYLRDVAYVHRGNSPQQNIVLVKGHQSILLQILKSGDASTLAVVSGVRAKLPATAQDFAARYNDHAAQRRLHLRARLDRGRGAGDGDRRVPRRYRRPVVRR